MFWNILIIATFVISPIVYAYILNKYTDINDITDSLMAGFVLGFFTTLLACIIYVIGIQINLSNQVNSNSTPPPQFEILASQKVETIEKIKVKKSTMIFVSPKLVDDIDLSAYRTFFIPWDNDFNYVIHIKEAPRSIFNYEEKKTFIYIPRNEFDEKMRYLEIDDENILESTYIDKANFTDKSGKSYLPSNTQNVTINEDVDKINEDSNDIKVKEGLKESLPIFKFDIVGDNYVVRCNDGTILTIDKDVVSVEESNDSINYIDKILQTVTDINGKDMSFYKYVIYKN